jgi:serine/threonine-protein kinase
VDEPVRDDDSLLSIASRIDEDLEIDWEAEASGARNDEERAVLAELRVLAALARVSRDPDGMEPPPETEVIAPDPVAAPVRWGSLTILNLVGRGAFGTVYRARDAFDRDVALKLFPLSGEESNELSARVLREGSLLAKVKHPNVVVVHGVDRAGDCVGLWMEYIRGRTMEEELKSRGPLSAEEATPIAVSLCRALAAVHGRGLVHRDIKAQNVMREEGGRTVLMDFGAGRELQPDRERPLDVAGTPLYLAPELFDRGTASKASDIYSLGVLIYRMVTGGYPVEGRNRDEIARAHRENRCRRLRDARPDLPAAFVQAVERAIAPNPAERVQTAGELEGALHRGDAPPVPQPNGLPWLWRAAAMAGIALLVAVPVRYFAFSRNSSALESANAQPPATAPVAPAPAVNANEYSVSASFYKYNDKTGTTRLIPGDSLNPGDSLSMRLESSKSVYVYVANVDDYGEKRLLFPLAGRTPANPLAAAKTHHLPGVDQGGDLRWQVSSEGRREHLLVYVAPTPAPDIEKELMQYPSVVEGQPVQRRSGVHADVGQLRSIGGLVSSKKPNVPLPSLFEDSAPLRNERETVQGAWIRRLTLENGR